MFSCCRANPEKDSTKQKNRKDKQKKNTEQEQAAENNDKKLIIPTITIENGGKLNDITPPISETPTPESDVGEGLKSVDESAVKCEKKNDVLLNQKDTEAIIETFFKVQAENPTESLEEGSSNCPANEDLIRVTGI